MKMMTELREYRKSKGLTLKALAEKLNIPVRTYQRYESGERKPDIQTAIRIADTLEVSDVRVIWGRQPLDTPV